MTRQEASEIIEQYRMCSSGDCPTLECADCEYNHDPRKVEEAFLMAIDALESAQPEHKKGKWIPVTYRYVIQDGEFPKTTIKWQDATEPDDVEGMKCSECGTIYDFTEARNWCSECGSDMRGENDETD